MTGEAEEHSDGEGHDGHGEELMEKDRGTPTQMVRESEREGGGIHSILKAHRLASPPPSPPASVTSSRGFPFFMCTPQSFPPTPGARSFVMARSEDLLFVARDQLVNKVYVTDLESETMYCVRLRAVGLKNGMS